MVDIRFIPFFGKRTGQIHVPAGTQNIGETDFQVFKAQFFNRRFQPDQQLVADISEAVIAAIESIDALHRIIDRFDAFK